MKGLLNSKWVRHIGVVVVLCVFGLIFFPEATKGMFGVETYENEKTLQRAFLENQIKQKGCNDDISACLCGNRKVIAWVLCDQEDQLLTWTLVVKEGLVKQIPDDFRSVIADCIMKSGEKIEENLVIWDVYVGHLNKDGLLQYFSNNQGNNYRVPRKRK